MAAIAWSIFTTIAKRTRQKFPRLGLLGQVRRARQQPRRIGHGAGALAQSDETFLEYHPTVLHDLHESVPLSLHDRRELVHTTRGSIRSRIDECQVLAYHEVEEMTKRGVPGVWTHGFYDGWAPNYMFYIATGHNSIGRFYETFGNGGADTRERTSARTRLSAIGIGRTRRFPRVNWSMRNNINMQQSANPVCDELRRASNKESFLNNFYLKSKRSVAKASNEGPAAYMIPADQPRPVEAADMVNLLRLKGIEVHQGRQRNRGEGPEVSGRFLHRSDGSAVFAHGRHAARHAVLQRQRSGALRRYRLDDGRDAQRQNRARYRQSRSRSPDDAAHR